MRLFMTTRLLLLLPLFLLHSNPCVTSPVSTSISSDQASDVSTVNDLSVPQQKKRVFLSRGWGPGGYEVVGQMSPLMSKFRNPPSRPIRKPTNLNVNSDSTTPAYLENKHLTVDEPYFLPLVAHHSQRPPQKSRKKENTKLPDYRRFHSLFTSSSWSPMGKRSTPFELQHNEEDNQYNRNIERLDGLYNYPLFNHDNTESDETFNNIKPGFLKVLFSNPVDFTNTAFQKFQSTPDNEYFNHDSEFLQDPQVKKSTVFASRGWGAGGVATDPLLSRKLQFKNNIPEVKISSIPENSIIKEKPRYPKTKYRIMTSPYQWRNNYSPMFHLFASSGWGPSGR